MFALVDCNNFYASCERVFNPLLNNKPVAILSNNDGCFISRSDEAKKLGLPMAAPYFKYRAFCKANSIHVRSSNYPLYGDMSTRVMNTLRNFTPEMEIYSIDEAFLKFAGFDTYDLEAYGKKIRRTVQQHTGIPISIGIAPTKALSKIANKIAKKFSKKTAGVFVIHTDESRIKALRWTPIESVWGIGHGHAKRLLEKGVATALDFTQLTDAWVKKNMAITGLRLKKDLEGEPTLDLDDAMRDKKTIATTRSFDHTYSDKDYIRERIATFAASCAEKLRKQGSYCSAVAVFLRSDKHKKDHPQERSGTLVTLPCPTNSTFTINNHALLAFDAIYKTGVNYKKAGVIVSGLTPMGARQMNLFQEENPKEENLMARMDYLNRKWDGCRVKMGNQDLKKQWKMRQEHLSPRYTTRLGEILIVK